MRRRRLVIVTLCCAGFFGLRYSLLNWVPETDSDSDGPARTFLGRELGEVPPQRPPFAPVFSASRKIDSQFRDLRDRLTRQVEGASNKDVVEQTLIAEHKYSQEQIHVLMLGIRRYLQQEADKHLDSQLSWRVHLLPYIEQQDLYAQFRLNESWDSPTNFQLIDKMPALYRGLADDDDGTHTRIQAINSRDSLGLAGQLRRLSDVTDAEGETLAVVLVSAALAVPWTSPQDLSIDEASFSDVMAQMPSPEFWWGSVEGAALKLPVSCSAETFFSLVTISGGEAGVFDRLQKERLEQIRSRRAPDTAWTPASDLYR
ncbi:MAG: DUF1559 domain-containing protein [Planctomycetaceae bacterium]|nr:DUF1559 domain-containing protein [Planctomycetaceae bacterium]